MDVWEGDALWRQIARLNEAGNAPWLLGFTGDNVLMCVCRDRFERGETCEGIIRGGGRLGKDCLIAPDASGGTLYREKVLA